MARYNFFAQIVNNTGKQLNFVKICKGKDEDPTGGDAGALYHGEMILQPTTQIPPGSQGSFAAKSTGSSIQGTVIYQFADGSGRTAYMYFHVPDLEKRHSESSNVTISIVEDSDHSAVSYAIK